MTRKPIPPLRSDRHFQWRGRDVSRLENLSDIVFALAITLIAATAVPTSFEELTSLWRDGLSTALSFALLLLIWSKHHSFFRRYDLEDSRTVLLNAVLLILVMSFVYPLKFLTDFVTDYFTGAFGWPWGRFDVQAVDAVLSLDQTPWLSLIYGGFFVAVFGVFGLMHSHALSRADEIGLSAVERSYTRLEIEYAWVVLGLTGLVIALNFTLPGPLAPMSGVLYSLLGAAAPVLEKRAQARLTDPA